MTPGSLRLRILLLSALSTGGALLLAWVLLARLFETQIANRFEAELRGHLEQLARAVEVAADGGIEVVRPVGGQGFRTAFGGLYWQVSAETPPGAAPARPLTSRSLWDEVLELPPMAAGFGETVRRDRLPFLDTELMALELRVLLEAPAHEVPARLTVAVDRAALERAKAEFGGSVLRLVAALGCFLVLAGALQVHLGLRPLDRLRARLGGMRAGRSGRLDGRFPTEIRQLVDELNALLDARDATVAQARARASDLAHGLKTPLAILAAESRRLASAGDAATSAEIAAQIDRMNRTVERELARARIRGGAGGLAPATPLDRAAGRLLGAFERLPDGAALDWQRDLPEGLAVAVDPLDLEEMLGNLLDNARKWARARVRIEARAGPGAVLVMVEDDGPGIPQARRADALARGGRLDESMPGTGLGLAIVRDILERYDGRMELDASPLGGLRVTLTLPAPG